MESFKEIISTFPDFNILSGKKYLAHLSQKNEAHELLVDHMRLTLAYLLSLIENNKLEEIINRNIQKIAKEHFNNISLSTKLDVFIKGLFVKAVYYHDLGKINENFQVVKMANPKFIENPRNGITSTHSFLSFYLYLAEIELLIASLRLDKKSTRIIKYISIYLGYTILKHHGKLKTQSENSIKQNLHELDLSYYPKLLGIETTDNFPSSYEINKSVRWLTSEKNKTPFEIFLLVKLLSSLLTAADYYATNEFMKGAEVNNYGVLTKSLKHEICSSIADIPYNYKAYENLKKPINISAPELKEISNQNLNLLRKQLSIDLINTIRERLDKKLFYIEAPTGSGKTNLSMLVLKELLENDKNITKVFYVFPFTTLITQTYNVLKETLCADSELVEIHSKAVLKNKAENYVEGNYGNDWKAYIDYLFVNYPICLLSHIKFFDILKSTNKDDTYLLHRLANSVVIIDELQAYNSLSWDKINHLLQNYSEAMNMRVVLMSATLPKISKITSEKDNFTYLTKDKELYFNNPNFKDRVKYSLKYVNTDYTDEWLGSIIKKHSEEYFVKNKKVRTIVEFITKTRAHQFYEYVKESGLFPNYKIIIITGTILEPRRKQIVSELKEEAKEEEKYLVISTQVIEAGVDIDMDLGFKDKSLLDAEEQLAGRINRNAKKTECYLYLFNTGDSQKTYRGDLKHEIVKKYFTDKEYEEILNSKDFDSYYEKVFERIRKDNDNVLLKETLNEFKEAIKRLDYNRVDELLKIIESKTTPVFVPLELGVEHFEEYEKELLKSFPNISANNTVSGEDIWRIYETIVENKMSFTNRKIELRKLASIMSKYTFSTYINEKNENEKNKNSFSHYGIEKYGYLYLYRYKDNDIYTFEDGLKADIETDINFIQRRSP